MRGRDDEFMNILHCALLHLTIIMGWWQAPTASEGRRERLRRGHSILLEGRKEGGAADLLRLRLRLERAYSDSGWKMEDGWSMEHGARMEWNGLLDWHSGTGGV